MARERVHSAASRRSMQAARSGTNGETGARGEQGEPERRDRSGPTGAAGAGETPGPSPELCRLLNLAAIDPLFFGQLRAAPAGAASAALAADGAFGCQLPDPALRLPPLCLTQTDWTLLGRLRSGRTLAEMWQRLSAGAAPAVAPGDVTIEPVGHLPDEPLAWSSGNPTALT